MKSTEEDKAIDVFVLQHTYENATHEDSKFIGVYRSESSALDAKSRLIKQSGFRDYPDGFSIDKYTLDEDHWTEGFVGDAQ